jgi:hypothetical protein
MALTIVEPTRMITMVMVRGVLLMDILSYNCQVVAMRRLEMAIASPAS